jgi:hypothetical protein
MKQLIEEYQTAIYRTAGNKRSPAGANGEGGQLEVARG